MATTHEMVGHVFNDDLLINDHDAEKAARHYRGIAHVLQHPELQQIFRFYDDAANAAKARRHRDGLKAVFLGLVSLMAAAALLVFHSGEPPWPLSWGTAEFGASILAALLGVASVVLAIGIMRRPNKEEWLCGRLMTERLRQLHFQTLICRLPEIIDSCRDAGGAGRFEEARKEWLLRFCDLYGDKLSAELSGIIESPERRDLWLHPEPEKIEVDDSHPIVAKVLEAYHDLRIMHQLQYTSYKLGESHGFLPRLPRSQARFFSLASFFCIGLLLVSDVGGAGYAVINAATQWYVTEHAKPGSPRAGSDGLKSPAPSREAPQHPTGARPTEARSSDGSKEGLPKKIEDDPVAEKEAKAGATGLSSVLHMAALWLAIVVLAVRALEEGLKPEREVERYVKYRSSIVRVQDRFKAAKTLAEKIEEMKEMERLAYDEMCDFLRTHHHARFLM